MGNKGSKGFTIYETLLVVGITAILATVTTVNFVAFKREQSLQLSRNEIIALLRNAQYRSMVQEESTNWSVHADQPLNGKGFFDLFKGASYNAGNVASRTLLLQGIQFADPAPGASKNITFNRISGEIISQTTLKIEIANKPSSSSTITIYQSGRIE